MTLSAQTLERIKRTYEKKLKDCEKKYRISLEGVKELLKEDFGHFDKPNDEIKMEWQTDILSRYGVIRNDVPHMKYLEMKPFNCLELEYGNHVKWYDHFCLDANNICIPKKYPQYVGRFELDIMDEEDRNRCEDESREDGIKAFCEDLIKLMSFASDRFNERKKKVIDEIKKEIELASKHEDIISYVSLFGERNGVFYSSFRDGVYSCLTPSDLRESKEFWLDKLDQEFNEELRRTRKTREEIKSEEERVHSRKLQQEKELDVRSRIVRLEVDNRWLKNRVEYLEEDNKETKQKVKKLEKLMEQLSQNQQLAQVEIRTTRE